MNEKALIIQDLFVSYPDFKLVIDHLELESGYVYGLIGRNGSGKTTFLRSIVNLVSHINDKVLIYGEELSKNEIELKNRIGYVNDEFIFSKNMTAKKLAKQIGPFYDNFDEIYFEQLLNEFNISKTTEFKNLSKGNKNKVMIAFVLAYKADLILLDEPTANLDPIARKEILDILYKTMEKDNCTILFSTHITSDLDKIADYILLIEDGRIIFNHRKDELEEEFQKVYLETIDSEIKPYLKGIKKLETGYEALCTKTSKFIHQSKYQFKRANIEDIMCYWEI